MKQGPQMPDLSQDGEQSQTGNANDFLRQLQREQTLLTQYKNAEKRALKRQNQVQKNPGYSCSKGTLGFKTKNR